jgi:hypothetical protein
MGKIKLSHPKKTLVVDYTTHFANLVSVNQSLNQGASEHYQKMGLTYVDVPEIVGITGACENVDTLFKVGNRLSLPLFITQTGSTFFRAITSIILRCLDRYPFWSR